jgi:putative transposase
MPRRTRNWLDRSCYHLTHRCLDKQYLFKNSITRDIYMHELREMTKRYKIDVLNYCVTSNHVHILVYSSKGTEIAKGMQYLQGRMGQRYNKFKKRDGAFWSGRYHATLIERGGHLSECLFYIDYNMMRAGAVYHPSEWKQCGYHELIGLKRNFTILNRNKLLWCLGMEKSQEEFLNWYNKTIESKSTFYMERQPHWTESLAVGGKEWIDKLKGKIVKKRYSIINTQKNNHKKTEYEISELPETSINERESQYAIY